MNAATDQVMILASMLDLASQEVHLDGGLDAVPAVQELVDVSMRVVDQLQTKDVLWICVDDLSRDCMVLLATTRESAETYARQVFCVGQHDRVDVRPVRLGQRVEMI